MALAGRYLAHSAVVANAEGAASGARREEAGVAMGVEEVLRAAGGRDAEDDDKDVSAASAADW